MAPMLLSILVLLSALSVLLAQEATLTISSPNSVDTYTYNYLIPFEVSASNGSFPIVTAVVDCGNGITSSATGNISNTINVRGPNFSGQCEATIATVDGFALYSIVSIMMVNITSCRNVVNQQGHSLDTTVQYVNFNFASYSGPLASASVNTLGVTFSSGSVSNLVANLAYAGGNPITILENSPCSSTTSIMLSLADNGTYSLDNCAYYDNTSIFYRPTTAFSTLGNAGNGIWTLGLQLNDTDAAATYNNAQMTLCLAPNFLIFNTTTTAIRQLSSVPFDIGFGLPQSVNSNVNIELSCQSQTTYTFLTIQGSGAIQSSSIYISYCLAGPCVLSATSADSNQYYESVSLPLEMYADLKIEFPFNGSSIGVGVNNDIYVSASDASTPTVTVNLACDDGTTTSFTGPANSAISILPNSLGICTIFLSSQPYYYNVNEITVFVKNALIMNYPLDNQAYTAYYSVPFNVTSNDGSYPIVTAQLLCNEVPYTAVGNISEIIYIRAPSGSINCEASILPPEEYAVTPQFVVINISQLTACQTVTNDTTESFGDSVTLTRSFDFPSLSGVLGSVALSSLQVSTAPSSVSTLTVISENPSGTLSTVLQNSPCTLVTAIDMSFSNTGTYSTLDDFYCNSYSWPSIDFQPVSPFPMGSSNGTWNIYLSATQSGASYTSSTLSLCLVPNYLVLNSTETVAVPGQPFPFNIGFGNSQSVSSSVSVTMTCGSASGPETIVEISDSIVSSSVTAPSSSVESCTITASAVSDDYYQATSLSVQLTATLTITLPTNGTLYQLGDTLSISVTSSDSSDPIVTAYLNCQNEIMSASGPISQPINITVTSGRGYCTVYLGSLPSYTVSNQQFVFVSLIEIGLNIIRPSDGSVIIGGANYTLLVTDEAGLATVPVTVYGTCDVGSFAAAAITNTPVNTTMDYSVRGVCLLTANSTDPLYLNSTTATQITVKTALNIVSPGPYSGWNYLRNNNAYLSSSSGQLVNGTVNIACSYNNIPNLNANVSVVDSSISNYNMTGFGDCVISTLFPTEQYLNTQSAFNSTVAVRASVLGSYSVSKIASSTVQQLKSMLVSLKNLLKGTRLPRLPRIPI